MYTQTRVMRTVAMQTEGTKREMDDGEEEDDDDDHEEQGGEGTHQRKDVVSCCIRRFREQVESNAIAPVTPATQSIKGLISGRNRARPRLPAGWARRAKHGKGFGVRYMKTGDGVYMKMIRKMFRTGVKRSGEKMGPAQMLERIVRKFPKRYDLPSMEEVSQAVSAINQGGTGGAATGAAGGRGRPALAERFPTEIGALDAQFKAVGGKLMPAAAVAWMESAGRPAARGWPEGLSSKAVRALVSKWRRAAKADGEGSESESDGEGE